MPELPEVETIRRELEPQLVGRTIEEVTLRRADLRIPFPPGFAKNLQGRRITGVARRAKYLRFDLEDGQAVLAHLGMSGVMLMVKTPHKPQLHEHVIWRLDDGNSMVFRDPRRFGLMTLTSAKSFDSHDLIAHLGPEPLGNAFHAPYLAEQLARRKSAAKIALMDQELVVGVGNIYASEALFRAGVSPFMPAYKAAAYAAPILASIRVVLEEAIASGGSTLRDYVRSGGETGYFQHDFRVYGREKKPCVNCQTPLEKAVQGARSTYFCPTCQPVSVKKQGKALTKC